MSNLSPAPAKHQASSLARRRATMGVLLAGAVVIGMGQTIVFAVLPPISRDLGLHDMQVLTIFMVSAVLWVTMGPIWGRMSDRLGRRPFVLTGVAAFGISMLMFATVIASGISGALTGIGLYILLVMTRSTYGLLGSSAPPAAQAYIADRTPPERRTAGLAGYSAAFGFGAMIGPSFAGAFAQLGPVAPLYAIAIFALMIAVTAAFVMREATPPKARQAPPRLSPLDSRIRVQLAFALTTAVAMALVTQFTSFYVIDRLGVAGSEALQVAGVALSASAGAALFAQVALVQRFNLSPRLLMRAGPAFMFVGHSIIALSASLGPLSFGMMLAGLGSGLCGPGVTGAASLAVRKEEQGAIAGLTNAAMAMSFLIAPAAGWAIYSREPRALFCATAGLALSAMVAAFVLPQLRTTTSMTSGE
ncbi:MAG: MFS transporter [Parvularculaceae bacterium]|nr:MAG: MFS transporter [Parvularculaceae bacterium]